MKTRRLGRTGHASSLAILGGAAYWDCAPADAEVSFAAALARGVNHLDIAPQYGDAEIRIGPFVPAVRDQLFITEKTLRKNRDGVRAQLEETLERLGTDHVDVYQLHGVTSIDELDTRAEAAEAIMQARDEGLARFVGITGHDLDAPRAHLEALHRWDLDTVMFPVYPRVWADAGYRDDAEALLTECEQRDVGVMAIKAVAWRPWGDRPKTAACWYEPFADRLGVERGVRFALSTPGVHAFCTPGDRDVQVLSLDAAESFTPMTDDEYAAAISAMQDEPVIFPLADNAR